VTGPADTPASPELLDHEADDLDSDAAAADLEPARLRMRAASLRIRAAALRVLDGARTALAADLAAAAAAESGYAGTAEGEAQAARRAVAARLEVDRAADAERDAVEAQAPPARLVELRMRSAAAAEIAEHEETALGRVRAARQDARGELDAARRRAADARERLAAAETAVADPAAAEPDPETQARNLTWTWQTRLLLDASGQPEWQMTPAERDLARAFARLWANMAGVGDNAARVEARRQVETHLRRMRIVSPNGTAIGAHELLGGH
jgi:hypothetical protein